MKRAILRSVLAVLCIYATFSGFSSKSFASEKTRGFVISSDSTVKTIEKVNNRITNTANVSSNVNSFVVNVDNNTDFSLAGLLSINNNGLIIPVKEGIIDDESKKILDNSNVVYVVGDKKSIPDDLLKGYDFKRLGSEVKEETNKLVNEFTSYSDLLIVDKRNSQDVLGAMCYANTYKMDLLFVDSTQKLDKYTSEMILEYVDKGFIYFYDGYNSLSKKQKKEIFSISKKDVNNLEGYVLDGKDVGKIFKDRFSSFKQDKRMVLVENKNITDMIYSYVLSEKLNVGFLIANLDDLNLDVEDLIKNASIKDIVFVSTNENNKYIPLRLVMSYINEEDFINFEINLNEGEIISVDNDKNTDVKNNASEEVSLKDDEILVDGKIVSKEEIEKKKAEEERLKAEEKEKKEKNESKNTLAVNKQNSKDFKYKKVLDMHATAYTNAPEENGGYTTTKMGTPLRYGVVAVDPKIIPLGTKLYVEGYGYAVAEDIGGAIKGNRIDLCFTDKSKVYEFGRKNVKVYILDN